MDALAGDAQSPPMSEQGKGAEKMNVQVVIAQAHTKHLQSKCGPKGQSTSTPVDASHCAPAPIAMPPQNQTPTRSGRLSFEVAVVTPNCLRPVARKRSRRKARWQAHGQEDGTADQISGRPVHHPLLPRRGKDISCFIADRLGRRFAADVLGSAMFEVL